MEPPKDFSDESKSDVAEAAEAAESATYVAPPDLRRGCAAEEERDVLGLVPTAEMTVVSRGFRGG